MFISRFWGAGAELGTFEHFQVQDIFGLAALHKIDNGFGRRKADPFTRFLRTRRLVWREEQMRSGAQRTINRQRLGRENIESSSRDSLFRESLDQRGFAYHRTTSCVDEKRAALHFPKLRLANHSSSFWRERGVNGNKIALGKQFVERNEFHAKLFRVWFRLSIVCEQAHGEPTRATSHSH